MAEQPDTATETTMAQVEKYAAPTDLAEAARLLAAGEATLLAGGTDLMPQTRSGVRPLSGLLLNLRRIGELRGVSRREGAIRLGALTTVTEVLGDPVLRERAPVLCAAADCFASDQVRNSATLGGNLCNASPAGDLIIPLLLLDAEVELASWSDGRLAHRKLPLCDFFVGPGQTRLRPDEILTAVVFAEPAAGFVAGFKKFGARPALDISIVSVGVAGVRREDRLTGARVALGAVAPTPLRGRRTEALLEGQPLTEDLIAAAAEEAAGEISPISDVRASAWYRTELVRVLLRRTLQDVL